MKEVSIALIPSYKPDNKLIKLVNDLSKENIEIIIVDDGSGKNYNEIFNKCKELSTVISYEENKGKGYALKTGLKYIKNNYKSNNIIVTMDSDGQHLTHDAKKLINECMNDNEKIYLGKRLRDKETPIMSRLGNLVTRFIYKVVTGTDIYDTQTGLRAFSDKLIDYLLKIEGDRFEYEMNVLLNSSKDKVKIKEVEIETIYIDNNKRSHFNKLKDSYRIYKSILKFIFKS